MFKNPLFSRKKVQQKINNFTNSRRINPPSSPESFASPDNHVVDINEKSSLRSFESGGGAVIHQPFASESSIAGSRHPVTSPHIQLDFQTDSASEWFPAELLTRGETLSPPQRNASLPQAGGSVSSLNGVAVEISRNANRSREAFNVSYEEIIVIEPDRETTKPADEGKPDRFDALLSEAPREPTPPASSRRPAPTPIIIPTNPTTAKIKVHRSASAGVSAGPSSHLLPPPPSMSSRADRDNSQKDSQSNEPSRPPSRPESTYSCSEDLSSSAVSGTTLARALVASSWIVSNESRNSRFKYTGVTRQDSATLPRGEHPFMNSPYWRDKRISNGEVVVSPDYAMGSPVPPVPPLPFSAAESSAGLDAASTSALRRRNSATGVELQHSQSQSDDMTEDMMENVYSSKLAHRRSKSLSRIQKEQLAARRFSHISEASSPIPSPGLTHSQGSPANKSRNSLLSVSSPSMKHQSISATSTSMSELNLMASSSSSFRDSALGQSTDIEPRSEADVTADTEVSTYSRPPSGADHVALYPSNVFSPEPPTTATSASLYSANSTDTRSFTGSSPMPSMSSVRFPNGSSTTGSPDSLAVFRSRSESGVPRGPSPSRPMILLPIGERPHSVQVPYTASPLSSRTSSDDGMRPQLPFRDVSSSASGSASGSRSGGRVPAVPVSARLSRDPGSPMDSPDLLDYMFPVQVQSSSLFRQRSHNRTGSHPAPISVPLEDLMSPEHSYHSSSSESPSTASAVRQTFPETPYAFSPLVSADFGTPPMPSYPYPKAFQSPRMRSLNRGASKKSRTPIAARHFGRSPSVSAVATTSSRLGSLGQSEEREPMSPPLASADSTRSASSDPGSTQGLSPLPAISEKSVPATPMSQLNSPNPHSAVSNGVEQVSSPTPSSQVVSPSPDAQSQTQSSVSSPDPESHSQSQSQTQPSSPSPSAHQRLSSSSQYPPQRVSQAISESGSPSVRSTASSSRPVSSLSLSHSHSQRFSQYSSLSNSNNANAQGSGSSINSTIPSKRSLTPLPTPPLATSLPLPPPPPSPSAYSHISHASELRSIIEDSAPDTHDQVPLPPYAAPEEPAQPPEPLALPPPYRSSTPELVTKRIPRSRPPPPSGPRRPSGPTLLLAANRARQGSVSSYASNSAGSSGTGPNRAPSLPLSASTPRFQISPIKFRGLTMEAAQWTFTSQQLQEVVSKAIKQSADASAIRLLPIDTLNDDLPREVQRLEALSAELRTNYKVMVRKRGALIGSLSSIADEGEITDQAAQIRMVEELTELSENLDHISEELYNVTDQLGQLRHLLDLHSSSALAMALRKLNTSFIKHMTEKEQMRQHIASLEAERDEAWAQAQEVAQEYDNLNDKVIESGIPTPITSGSKDASSRRSSRVIIARKTSIRASKAGLRSPSRHRSQRSSAGSSLYRSSMASSPGVRLEDIPPVPPIPGRTPSLGIVTTDLPARSAGLTSEFTPSSDSRAMAEAQRELCDMLGITVEELTGGSLPKRRNSTSAMVTSPSSTKTRHNSEIVSPGQRPDMYTDDLHRAAVLAKIGMSHEY